MRRFFVCLPAAAAALCLAAISASAQAQTRASVAAPRTVAGQVFLDANGNGKREQGEKPLADVRVTDGVGFVVTGSDGAYRIDVADDPVIPYKPAQVVSVSWPSGTWPSGRWWVRLSELKAGQRVDFALRKDEQAVPFAFLHVTDDHGSGGMYDVLGPKVKPLAHMVRFCVNTGDLGYASQENADQMFSSIAARAKRFSVPMLIVPGNHDVVGVHTAEGLKQDPLAGNGGYTKYLGPVRWSFDYADAHFVGIDWIHIEHGKLEAGVPEVAAEWLEADLKGLAKGTRKFLFVHFPTGCRRYYDVISRHKVTYLFGGHNHTARYYNFAGIPAVTANNLRGQGGGNLGIVQKDGFDVVEYCEGCKTPDYHSRRCALRQLTYVLLPALQNRRGKTEAVSEKSLADADHEIDLGAVEAVEVVAEIEPGTAKRAGLRIGRKGPLEIAFTKDRLHVAGVPIPFVLKPHDKKTLRWHVVIEGGKLTLYANNRVRLIKPVQMGRPGAVRMFAEGGAARFQKVQAWQLTAAPKTQPKAK